MSEIERIKEREVEIKETEKELEEAFQRCPECKSFRIVMDWKRGEFVCQDCGLVIAENYIDPGPEWRSFDKRKNIKDPRRTGSPLSHMFHDKGLFTTIDWTDKDFQGRPISVKNKAQFLRLRKWQKKIRLSNATERNLLFALSELDRMASALGVPKFVKERSALIYRKIVEKGLTRGRSIEGIVGAVLYIVCREKNIPRTLYEVAMCSRLCEKEIRKTYRYIIRELSLKLPPPDPADYVRMFCAKLNLPGNVREKAIEIIKKAEERKITSGRRPTGLAAAAIYIAVISEGEKKTQREIAEIAGVTEVTVRNRYKELTYTLGSGNKIFIFA
jgi:transcription initiation factor TFIIB